MGTQQLYNYVDHNPDVDYAVTEYGVAHLKGKALRERAKALIAIAHPDFRLGLVEEFQRRIHRSY